MHDLQIDFDNLFNPGSLDLDRHFGPVLYPGFVHLADGGRCQRLLIEMRKQFIDGQAQVGFNNFFNGSIWKGGDFILQFG